MIGDITTPNYTANVGTLQPFALTSTAAAGALTITIPAIPGRTICISSIGVTGSGATGALVVTATLTNANNGAVPPAAVTLNWVIVAPAGVSTSITPLIVTCPSPIQALTTNTSMVFTVPTFGAGNTNVAAVIHGFYV